MIPRIHKDTGWRLFVRTVLGRAYSRAVGYQRQLSRLAIEVGLPLVALMAYIFVYRAIGGSQDLIGYVILGGAMSWFWVNVIWSMASQFFWERQIGNLALYIIAPGSMMAILLGMALGGMVLAAVRAGLIIVLGSLLFHISYAVSSVPLLILVFFLTMAALYAMGMMSASLFLLFGREARYFIDVAQEPVYLISGTYFPLAQSQRLDCRRGVLDSLDLGPGCAAADRIRAQRCAGFSEPENRKRHSAGTGAHLPRGSALVARIHGAAGGGRRQTYRTPCVKPIGARSERPLGWDGR